MKCLITGSDGFLGRSIATHFASQGHQVIGLGSPRKEDAAPTARVQRLVLPLESSEVRQLIAQEAPDLCIHAAGGADVRASMKAPLEDFSKTLPAWLNVLEGVRAAGGSCKCLFLSSAAIYGDPATLPISDQQPPSPVSPYGYHKWMGEIALREYTAVYRISGASLRIFSGYGEGLRRQVVWDLAGRIIKDGKLTLSGTGRESRDFVHADDVARAALHIAEKAPLKGEAYNVASGEEITIGQIASWIREEHAGAPAPDFDGIVPPGVPHNWRADISSLSTLGWQPSVASEKGLRQFMRWCLAEQKNLNK